MSAESKEAVALELLKIIAYAEDKALDQSGITTKPQKTWVISTYRECLNVVEGK